MLASSSVGHSESELAHCLGQAAQAARPAVWIDCRLLDGLSATAGRLLRRLHHCLRQRQAQLVLCRVSDSLARSLHAAGAVPDAGFALANSLDEAAAGTNSRYAMPNHQPAPAYAAPLL